MAGVIQKIRNMAGLVVGLIGLSLLIFILTDLLQTNTFFQELLFGRSDVVAKIGDEEIKYATYNQQYERSVRAQAPQDPMAQEQLRNALWQQILSEKLYELEIAPLGLSVSDQELGEMFVGEEPHPLVMQVFSQGEQVYERERVRQILAQASNNPELASQLREFEIYLEKVRRREKYDALLKACAYVPAPLAAYQNVLDNTMLDFSYLAVSYSAIADTAVKVSEADIKNYYSAHKEEYRLRESERVIRYVVFYKEPSGEDSTRVLSQLLELRGAFAEAKDDSIFAAAQSDLSVNGSFQRLVDLPSAIQDSIKAGLVLIGPYSHPNGYAIGKVDTIIRDSQPVYQVRHLMIAKGLDSVAARRRADSLYRVLTPAKFAEAVNAFSDDWQTRFASGELGWYDANGRFGKAFYEALAKAPLGRLYGVINSDQGYHIVEVRAKEERRVRYYEIVKEVRPSTKTLAALRQQAQQFTIAAERDFDGAASQLKQNIRLSPALRPSSATLPGLLGTSEVLRWAFEQEKVGAFSGVMEVENAYLVAQLVKADDPPYRTWEAVRDLVEPKVRNAKKAALIQSRLKGKTLEEYKAAYGAGAYVSRASDAQYGSVAVPGLGMEPKVLGTAAGLDSNAISSPVEGNNAVYVLQLMRKVRPAEPTPAAARGLAQSQSATLANQLVQRFESAMRERLDVQDYRYRFGF